MFSTVVVGWLVSFVFGVIMMWKIGYGCCTFTYKIIRVHETKTRHVLKNVVRVELYLYKLKLLSGDKSRLTNRLGIKLTLNLP